MLCFDISSGQTYPQNVVQMRENLKKNRKVCTKFKFFLYFTAELILHTFPSIRTVYAHCGKNRRYW